MVISIRLDIEKLQENQKKVRLPKNMHRFTASGCVTFEDYKVLDKLSVLKMYIKKNYLYLVTANTLISKQKLQLKKLRAKNKKLKLAK